MEVLIRGHFFTLDKMISSHNHCTLFLFGVLGTRVVPGRVGGWGLPSYLASAGLWGSCSVFQFYFIFPSIKEDNDTCTT